VPSSADAGAANPGEPPVGAAAPPAATSNELDPAEPPLAADRVAPAEQVPAAPPLAEAPPAPESQSAAPPPTAPQSSGAAVNAAAPVPGTPRVVESGGWVVQLSAQRTEAEAQSAFRGMQTKYSMLGSYQPLIRKRELGQRGVFYAAQVGPLAREEANQLCEKLKRAGGSCFVQRN
jgi:SPOR domain